MLVRNLEQAATLKANPVSVLFNFQVQGFPLLSTFEIEFLYQVGPLASVETSHHIQRGAVKGDSGMEVSLGVEAWQLGPLILSHIINLAFIHRFIGKRGTYSENLTFLSFNEDTGESVSTSLE